MLELLKNQIEPGMLIFSIPMGVILLYWVCMIVGFLDIEFLDSIFGGVDGVADGAIDGAAQAGMETVTEVGLETVADAAIDAGVDGAADGAAEAGGESLLASFFAFLGLGQAPATVVITILVFSKWIFANIGYALFSETFMGSSSFATIGFFVGLFVLCLLTAAFFTHFASKPFKGLMVVNTVHGHHHLTGEVCVIMSGRVTATSGQAEIWHHKSSLLLMVRCDHDNKLSKGDKAVIVEYDEDAGTYLVTPLLID